MTILATPPAREAVASDSTLVNEDSTLSADGQAHKLLAIAQAAALGIRGRRRREGMQIRIELSKLSLGVPDDEVISALNRLAPQYGLAPGEPSAPGIHHLRIT